jgi:hypothetical protein
MLRSADDGLISPGTLAAPLTLSRAQVSAFSTALLPNEQTWVEFGADVPRFDGSPRWLVIEGQRTNLMTTARAPATETVTVTAAAHVLSFVGTGSITLSGVATGTLSGTGETTRVFLTFTPTAGALTLTVAGSVSLAQLELGAFASTPILPPVGAPGASTRGADLITAPLSSRGIPASGACTVLMTAMIPQNAPAGMSQMLMQIDSGGDGNRFGIRNAAGGANVVGFRSTASVLADSTAAVMTAGTPFRCGLSIDGAGRAAFSFNGGAAVAVTGGPTSGLTTLRLGNAAAGVTALFGEVGTVQILPAVLSDADLAARVAALPL